MVQALKIHNLNAMEIQQLMNFNDSNWNLFAIYILFTFWYFHWFPVKRKWKNKNKVIAWN